MKKFYVTPTVKVVEIEKCDIICDSPKTSPMRINDDEPEYNIGE